MVRRTILIGSLFSFWTTVVFSACGGGSNVPKATSSGPETTGSADTVTVGSGTMGATTTGSETVSTTTTGSATVGGTTGAQSTTSAGAATTSVGATSTGMGGSGGNAGTSGIATSAGGAGTDGTAATTTGGDSVEPCTGSGSLSAGDSAHSLTVGDYTYPMNVHVPASYDGVTRMPVVFDFHGLGGDENQMQRLSGWAGVGDANGFITAFPGGPDNGWNAGGCCTDTPTDVDFVRQAITYLDSEGCIDTKRIYASGCSNGGAVSFRLACEAADVIAAVAPVDFDCVAGGFGCSQCDPGRPITEIQFRATEDQAVDYGTESSGARANFATWGGINQCTGEPEAWQENSSCQRQTMCADGVETILCTVEGGTHCANYMTFDIANLAWGVISQYSLP